MTDVGSAFLPSAMWNDGEVWDDSLFWTDQTIVASLLPSSATNPERAIEQATARPEFLDIPLRTLWNPATCSAELLPWLAWGLSVDEWESSWPEGRKREVIALSVSVHRRKGTVGAVRDAIAAAGLGGAVLTERFGRKYHDGSLLYDGTKNHDEPDHWAEYRLTLDQPISIAQAAQVRRIVGAVAPVRSHLRALDYQQAVNLYDAAIVHDGTYSHGVA
ncbi:phage tail protein I [Pararhodobacter zhoushanensis]|uniref:phage tail protein I n=1 Tax=Pararhodobacter zhoushanensis TaxID=2479545 RepID=UPI001FE5D3DB|nr:phage tail protein I [Pararhodobacter zhoushanensis]